MVEWNRGGTKEAGGEGRVLFAGPPPKFSFVVEDAGTGQSTDENLKMKWEKLTY